MKQEDKKLKILKDHQNGKIRVLGNGSYSTPNEYFVLGITPRLINEVMKEIKFDLENKKVNN